MCQLTDYACQSPPMRWVEDENYWVLFGTSRPPKHAEFQLKMIKKGLSLSLSPGLLAVSPKVAFGVWTCVEVCMLLSFAGHSGRVYRWHHAVQGSSESDRSGCDACGFLAFARLSRSGPCFAQGLKGTLAYLGSRRLKNPS